MKSIVIIFLSLLSIVSFAQTSVPLYGYYPTSGTNTFTITPSPAISSYQPGYKILVKFTAAPTGPSTINVSGLGAKGIKKNVIDDLSLNDIGLNEFVWLFYDGTNFQASVSGSDGVIYTASNALTLTGTNFTLGGNQASDISIIPSTDKTRSFLFGDDTKALAVFGINTDYSYSANPIPSFKTEIIGPNDATTELRISTNDKFFVSSSQGIQASSVYSQISTSDQTSSETSSIVAESGTLKRIQLSARRADGNDIQMQLNAANGLTSLSSSVSAAYPTFIFGGVTGLSNTRFGIIGAGTTTNKILAIANSSLTERFAVQDNGVFLISGSAGTSGQVLTSQGSGGAPIWGTGGGAMSIGGSITSATQGSVLFAGTSGVLTQNNANFFWDNTNLRLGINVNNPIAPLQIGVTGGPHLPTGIDAGVLLQSVIASPETGPSHGFVDASGITRGGGISYASFDAKANFATSNSYGHYAAFQARGNLTTSAGSNMDQLYGFIDISEISGGGSITDRYGLNVAEINMVGGSTVTNDYGVYVASLTNGSTSNWAIYTAGTTKSTFGGAVGIGSTTIGASSILDLTSTAKALTLTRVTNIASVSTPANGMVTYDAATNLFNFRQNGAWVTLSGASYSAGNGLSLSSTTFSLGGNANADMIIDNTNLSSPARFLLRDAILSAPEMGVVSSAGVGKIGFYNSGLSFIGGLENTGSTGDIVLRNGGGLISMYSGSTQVLTMNSAQLKLGTGTSFNASAALEIVSTTRTLLLPRVTNIASVVTPVDGMVAYDATTNKFNFRENSTWLQLSAGGGITNTAANTELMMSDGTNAVPSGLFSNAGTGSLNLGSSSISSGRVIQVASSSTNASLEIYGKGNTAVSIGNTGTTSSVVNIASAGSVIDAVNFNTTSASNVITGGISATGNPFIITGRQSNAVNTKGSDLQLLGGDAYSVSGNANGGNVYINTGAKMGTGTAGNIGLFTISGSFGAAEKALFWPNATTNPSTSVTGGGVMYSSSGMPFWWTGTTAYSMTGSSSLSTLSDVTLTSPAADQVLRHDGTNWKNAYPRSPIINQSGTTYTLVATDQNKILRFTNSSSVTVTLPNGLATDFSCVIVKAGTGDVTIVATTTLNPSSGTIIQVQYNSAVVYHLGSNVWETTGSFGPGFESGTYTPTLSNTTNVTSSTPIVCHYKKTGNEVTVTGSVGVVTTLAVTTVLGISLPTASNFTATTDASGLAQASSAIAANAYVEANTSTDIGELKFTGLSVGGSGTIFFTFTYTVL